MTNDSYIPTVKKDNPHMQDMSGYELARRLHV